MARIFIDNNEYEVADGQNLLQACLSLGFDIPYFCWHPAMHSVGACRQCAVKLFRDEKDTRGRIIMSCMTSASEGVRISIDDPEARAFRADVIEWLMINHPHDCPVCDEGGECHLQDMTLMTGHVRRRYRFKKRTYKNQYLGPFLNHEMNRCIQCYRCVRFYRGYAGGRDLDVFGSHDNVYFGRSEDGVLENEFSGNLVEVCPTGVFTDKTLKSHYTRKWDLQTAPSVCVHCGVGCNTIPGERYGELRRVLNRYNGEVNRYFLCDRGRYGYEFVNGKERLAGPVIRYMEGGALHEKAVTAEEAMSQCSALLSKNGGVIGIGSPRASLEANYALMKLVGKENFYNGMSESDSRLVSLALAQLKDGPVRSPSLREVETSDAVFILGEDVTNTAPVLALTLRQAARQHSFKEAARLRIPPWDDAAVRTATQSIKGNLYIATPFQTKLEDAAAYTYHGAPDDIARFGFAVAHELDLASPAVDRLDEEIKKSARSIAEALKKAERPLVVSGPGCGSEAIIQAAAAVARALCTNGTKALLSYVMDECNSMGVCLMSSRSIKDAFAAAGSMPETLIVLENDLYRRADKETADRFLKRFRSIVALDSVATATTEKAAVAFPSASFAESDGTLVNSEGRAQRFYKVFLPKENITESWRLLKNIMTGSGQAVEWNIVDDVAAELAKTIPVFGPVIEAAPQAEFRVEAMKIARQPQRYSGRTAMHADKTVFEPAPPGDHDSPLTFSMEGFQGRPPSALLPRIWAPGWNSAQAINKFQSSIGGALKGGDPGRRLIEPAEKRKAALPIIPAAFAARRGEWLIIPRYHIFGSEEMSMRSPSVAGLAPKPYIALSIQDAGKLEVSEGEDVLVKLKTIVLKLALKYLNGLPAGVAAITAGLPGFTAVALPAWGVLSKVKVSAA